MCQDLDYEYKTSFRPQGAHSLMGEVDAAADKGQLGCLALEPHSIGENSKMGRELGLWSESGGGNFLAAGP